MHVISACYKFHNIFCFLNQLSLKKLNIFIYIYIQFLALFISFNRPKFLYGIISSVTEEFPLIFFGVHIFWGQIISGFVCLNVFVLPAFLNAASTVNSC